MATLFIEEIRRRSGGAFDLPEGTIYPALHRLEQAGLLREQLDDGRLRPTPARLHADANSEIARWSSAVRFGNSFPMRSAACSEDRGHGRTRHDSRLSQTGWGVNSVSIRRLSRSVQQEVEDHLWEAVGVRLVRDVVAAQQRAIANFGDARAIAAQFAVISLTKLEPVQLGLCRRSG